MNDFVGWEKCQKCRYRARWYNTFFKPIWFHNCYEQAWLCMRTDYGEPHHKHDYLYCQCANDHNKCEDYK